MKDKKLFFAVYQIYTEKVCSILKQVGININTVPVLDVIRNQTHNFIGNRAFSGNYKNVSFVDKQNLTKASKLLKN